jgi:pyrroloquinoline quinone biosynthesis protein D
MIDPATVPFLPRGVRLHDDRVRGMTVLLAPERALKLDPPGAAVLAELDGRASFGEIVDRLAARFDAPPDRIAEDAGRFLAGLVERRMVELAP